MNKFLYAMIGLTLTACAPSKKSQTDVESQPLAMIVGTYTSGNSCGIYSYTFDEDNGVATQLDSATVENPSYLTLSGDNRFIYAVSEKSDSTASVYSYAFNRENGKLTELNHQLTHGEDPCYIETNGKLLITANYSGGSMSVFPLQEDGSLLPLQQLYKGSTGGPDSTRQQDAHVHYTTFTPDGEYILATDFSADRILRYRLDGANNPVYEKAFAVDGDTGPRHMAMSADGKQLYVIGELSGNITAMHYNDGELEVFQTVTADTLHARGSADIHLSPDGKFLYASNRLKGDGIAIFRIQPNDGSLTAVGYQPTGIHPRNFNITPNGKYLLVACRDSNAIEVYLRNEETGLLENTGKNIPVSQPVCIRFAK